MENARCGLNVKDYGAKGDAKKVSDGVIKAKSIILTSKTANFKKVEDNRKTINIEGAGIKAGSLLTTIASMDDNLPSIQYFQSRHVSAISEGITKEVQKSNTIFR
jgi:hypothetical protein